MFSYFNRSFVIIGFFSCRMTRLPELILKYICGLEFPLQMPAGISRHSDMDVTLLSLRGVGVRKLQTLTIIFSHLINLILIIHSAFLMCAFQ